MLENSRRRVLLKASLSTACISLAATTGLLAPLSVLAAWPAQAFNATKITDALKHLQDDIEPISTEQIVISVPDFAENGAKVPVTIESTLNGLDAMMVFVSQNDTPLAASFKLHADMQGYISTRIKFKESDDIVVIARADGKLYSTSKHVKVSIGGCGPQKPKKLPG